MILELTGTADSDLIFGHNLKIHSLKEYVITKNETICKKLY